MAKNKVLILPNRIKTSTNNNSNEKKAKEEQMKCGKEYEIQIGAKYIINKSTKRKHILLCIHCNPRTKL